jgi:gluconolactonase
MKLERVLIIALGLTGGIVALGQAPAPGQGPANVQGPQDPRYAEVIAACKVPPPTRGGGAGRGQARGAGGGAPATPGAPAAPGGQAARGAAPAGRGAPAGPRDYTVTAIPGVIAAGQQWKVVWEGTGNNADGILASGDGGLLAAQNDNGAVLKLDRDGKASIAYSGTRTGGALSMNSKGALFIAERALNPAIRQLAPESRVLANRFRDDPLDCIGGVLNDLTADSKGGAYFTMGGLFYASPAGVVTQYGENLATNGVILSADEKTLYVTNGGTVAAFDVRPDGSLANQRVFVTLQGGGGGDGLAVDSAGRVYVTGGPGVHVAGADGTYLGLIPTPRGVITAAFAGPDKKTLYAVANDRVNVQIFTIPMIAQGYPGRAK